MSRTITALFDTRADAEAAKNRLHAADIDADHVHVHDQASTGSRTEGEYSTHEDRGFWDSVKNAFLPDEDRHVYEEGVRRGGALLVADVDDDEIDEAVRVLEDSNTIDIDDRARDWRAQGWDYTPGTAGALGAGALGTAGRDRDGDETYPVGNDGSTTLEGFGTDRDAPLGTDRDAPLGTEREGFVGRGNGDTVEEEAIPVVEERLQVGKREVERGGVRVRTYVTETPVHEQLRLRNERVDVERRAVDQPLSAAEGDAFRERTVEMTARGEEAMIAKEARVVEEVVVRKTADEEVRDIDDTVRRTDVEVDDLGTTRTDRTEDRGIFGRDKDPDRL